MFNLSTPTTPMVFKTFVIVISCYIILSNNVVSAQEKSNTFRFPGEFERQKAVWVGWENENTDIQKTVGAIIKGLSGKVLIKIGVPTSQIQKTARQTLLKMNIDVSRIQFHIVPGSRLWIRDNGSQFLINDEKDVAAVDFNWSNYGYYDWLIRTRPELADYYLALKMTSEENHFSNADKEMASLVRARRIKSELVMEGGSLESNGKGVLIQSEQVTLQRNPDWTKEEIENEYLRIMNIKKVIWLKNGTVDDSRSFSENHGYVSMGTGGHTDEFVRFADAHTILLAWVDDEDINKHPLNQINHQRMLENYNILKNATDQDGKPFKVVKIPLPAIIEWQAELVKTAGSMEFDKVEISRLSPHDSRIIGNKVTRLASVSYLNFLVSNGVFINASYTNHGTPTAQENKVKAIFKEVFPNLEQIWIDTFPLNRNGGGIHCVTLQEPLGDILENNMIP